MKYNRTEYKDKNDRNVYAKDSCNVCSGTGKKGILKGTGQHIVCQCTKVIKDDEGLKQVDVRRK